MMTALKRASNGVGTGRPVQKDGPDVSV
jgi:hypothetical protein